MDIQYHVETAWQLFLSNIKSLVILTLVLAGASILSLGILVPVCFAGYTDSLYRLMKTGREPKAQDIFLQMRLFIPLLIFSLVILVITGIGFTLIVIPGFIFAAIVGYTCLYMVPVMVDLEYGLVDAVKKSIAMVTQSQVTEHVIVFIIFYALTTVGGSSFFGFLLLQPFATLFLLSVYDKNK